MYRLAGQTSSPGAKRTNSSLELELLPSDQVPLLGMATGWGGDGFCYPIPIPI